MEIKFKKPDSDKFKENINQAKEEMKQKMEEAKRKMQEGAAKIKIKNEEPVKVISIEEAKEIMKKNLDEHIQKEAEKHEKVVAKLEKSINDRVNNNTKLSNQVKELLDSNVITLQDLYNPVTFKKKNFYDIIEKFNVGPTEDEPNEPEETTEEKDLNDIHQVQFTYESSDQSMGQNIFATEESYVSSDPVVDGVDVTNNEPDNSETPQTVVMFKDEITDRIISDLTIKGIFPEISDEDICIENGMIIIRIPRTNGEENTFEMFRLDIIKDVIYVQAPIDGIMPNIKTGSLFKFISVPVESEIGIKILSEPNYKVPIKDIDINSSLFREFENAA